MGACDVFTLASQWEGLPVALMEALALGLPVVATNVGGVAEEMHDGVDALLVRPSDPPALADALERVVTDPALRDQLGAASFARAGDFDVHRAVDRIESRLRRARARRCGRTCSTRAGTGASARSRRGSTSVRRRRTIGRRSSSCAVPRSAGATIPASSCCFAGSTSTMHSAVLPCGWHATAIGSSGCEPSCAGSSNAPAGAIFRCRSSGRHRDPSEVSGQGNLQPPPLHASPHYRSSKPKASTSSSTPRTTRAAPATSRWAGSRSESSQWRSGSRARSPRSSVARSRVASSHWPLAEGCRRAALGGGVRPRPTPVEQPDDLATISHEREQRVLPSGATAPTSSATAPCRRDGGHLVCSRSAAGRRRRNW